MSIFGITIVDLQNFSSIATVASVFNDLNDGIATPTLNMVAINAVIDRGEQEVLSFLGSVFGPPPFTPATLALLGADPALKYAALEYIVLYMFDRHPEYVRNGSKDRAKRKEDADLRMERYLNDRQRPPTVPIVPDNVGGFANTRGPRIYTDGPTGRRHSGDY